MTIRVAGYSIQSMEKIYSSWRILWRRFTFMHTNNGEGLIAVYEQSILINMDKGRKMRCVETLFTWVSISVK